MGDAMTPRPLLAAIALSMMATHAYADDRFNLLGSYTWHGSVSGSFSIWYTSMDRDTIMATSFELREYGPIDYSGYPTWQLVATYHEVNGQPCYNWLSPSSGCNYTAQWDNCPVETWRGSSGDYNAILDCRTWSP